MAHETTEIGRVRLLGVVHREEERPPVLGCTAEDAGSREPDALPGARLRALLALPSELGEAVEEERAILAEERVARLRGDERTHEGVEHVEQGVGPALHEGGPARRARRSRRAAPGGGG